MNNNPPQTINPAAMSMSMNNGSLLIGGNCFGNENEGFGMGGMDVDMGMGMGIGMDLDSINPNMLGDFGKSGWV